MRHAGVAGDGLHQGREQAGVAAEQEPLGAAVLVAQVDLQVVHRLAEAGEAEVPGLDDAGVDEAHVDLVDLLALDAIERIGVHRRLVLALVADRAKPRVASDADPELLVQLPLEAVQRRDLRVSSW
ncbi:MAG: hypothetical protein IPO09_15480 [Anaeromyxobacter sp.]|nr:hypothetical protein [Anaeromyxobacter sp.]